MQQQKKRGERLGERWTWDKPAGIDNINNPGRTPVPPWPSSSHHGLEHAQPLGGGQAPALLHHLGAVERYGRRIPPFAETQNYVRLISTKYRTRYAGQSALRGATPAPPPLSITTGPASPPVAWRISVDFDDESGKP